MVFCRPARGCGSVRLRHYGKMALLAPAAVIVATGAALAAERPPAAVMLDRLCAHTLRANEEDRLYGDISITVRTTIRYVGGFYAPEMIDDALQNSIFRITEDCPGIAAMPDAERLGYITEIVVAETLKLLGEGRGAYSAKAISESTAADLSEELSAREIDSWLDGLPPRRRALALFLYASNVTPSQVAAAVGVPERSLPRQSREAKESLLKYFREDPVISPPAKAAAATAKTTAASDAGTPGDPDPAMSYSEGGRSLASLLPPASPPEATVSGISRALYAGWSLLARVSGVPRTEPVVVAAPFLLVPDTPGHKRMMVTDLQEIPDARGPSRLFLLRAFAIDGNKKGSALDDSFSVGPGAVTDPAVLRILNDRGLAAIEKARCLSKHYNTGADPGLCPATEADGIGPGPTPVSP